MMNKQQIQDMELCEQMALEGKDKDCFGCSCNVCLAQTVKIASPKLKYYDPNRVFGEHTIKVTLQAWEYRGSIWIRVGGNCKGLEVMNSISELLYDNTPSLRSDCDFEILGEDEESKFWYRTVLRDGDKKLTVEDLLDNLEELIVAVEIVDFTPEDSK